MGNGTHAYTDSEPRRNSNRCVRMKPAVLSDYINENAEYEIGCWRTLGSLTFSLLPSLLFLIYLNIANGDGWVLLHGLNQ